MVGEPEESEFELTDATGLPNDDGYQETNFNSEEDQQRDEQEFINRLENNLFEDFDYNRGIIGRILGQDKGDLFKSLAIQIVSYNKYIIEESKTIVGNEKYVKNQKEVKESIISANHLLKCAAERVKKNDIVSALAFFYCARERRVKVLQALDDIDEGKRMDSMSFRMIEKGEQYCGDEWVDSAKKSLFNHETDIDEDDNISLDKDIRSQEIIPWIRDIHGGIYRELASVLLVRKLLLYFNAISLVVLPILAIIIYLSGLLEMIAINQHGTVAEAPFPIIYQEYFLYLIFLVGIIGSAINTVRNWPNQLLALRPEQPRLSITKLLISSRLIFGGIAASLTYFLILAGSDILQPIPELLILTAFAAGFADQFISGSIEHSLESKLQSGELSPRLFDRRER